ncbi:ferroportin-like [Diadema setosum]|uniref:ferroportin-like n=1 Tax=Diadema setosum TaxID=31175 RepID=UPI003B3A07FF
MSNAVLLYTSQALSAWGDRMWSFAVSLYLVEIEEQSLRLTAVYGLCVSGSSLLFGAAVGRWVDKTPRLRAARTSLIIQNSSVIINACILCTVLLLKEGILPIWNGALYIICQLIIILLGTIASLASLAEKICIQKDWVVVVAGNDKEVLVNLNANMRRIDLLVNIVAPIAVGAIMSASMLVGGIFIAAWNAGSMAIEYWNLHRVYRNVPELAMKGGVKYTDEETEQNQYSEMTEPVSPERDVSTDQPSSPAQSKSEEDGPEKEFTEIPVTPLPSETPSQPAESKSNKVVAKLKDMFEGWKVYHSYDEFWAGLGLAFLYMTVLGFDSITNGYAYSQGVPEWAIGLVQAFGSISGIVGTLLFPFMRNRVGLERSGLYSLSIQISFLMLCLGSVWAPGSPMLYDYSQDTIPTDQDQNFTLTTASLSVSPRGFVTSSALPTTPSPDFSRVQCKYNGSDEQQTSYISISLFFSGLVFSRIGLWSYDLVTTQLIQEQVRETERGVFNGVQRAMECSFDMLHFILVIVLPCPETYGYLIMVSICFVACGLLCFMVYSRMKRGHLLHLEKLAPCMKNGHA